MWIAFRSDHIHYFDVDFAENHETYCHQWASEIKPLLVLPHQVSLMLELHPFLIYAPF